LQPSVDLAIGLWSARSRSGCSNARCVNFLCLEDEIANPGDCRATVVGQMPVVVARNGEGEIAAFENRGAHRGALICLDNADRDALICLDNADRDAKDFQCV
jgi:phenylpropionate dioxygenase-like ring-hydroxylating dioxygenase large terminal subunit